MKKRDFIILALSFAVIGFAVFMMFRLLSPSTDSGNTSSEADNIPTVPGQIDETTYRTIEGLSDYGEAALENIGKKDLFAGF